MNLDYKKIYYYIIALITFFVLLWGAIDLLSAAAGMITDKGAELGPEKYYQLKIAQDRIFDSLARILVSGIVFFYARFKLFKLERS